NFNEEYIRLRYLMIEKFSELAYMVLYKVPIDETTDLNIEKTFKKIEKKSGQPLSEVNDLHKWRLMRNDIVHDHYKVGENEIEQAKQFFNDVETQFEKILAK
ncbi:MAG: hypothetical protein R6U96_19450, partial [Promethearchaeia archaeon]